MLNGQGEQLTAAVGATLPFSGTVCAAQNAQLDTLQVKIQSALDATQSTVYYQTSQIGAQQFDLSQIPSLVVGSTGNFSMEVGKSYDVTLSVTDTNGKGFESDPTIRLNVEDDKTYAVQVHCDLTEAYVGSTATWTAEAKNGLAPYKYTFQLYKDGTRLATRAYNTSAT